MPADVAATWLENDVSILDHSYGKEDSKLGPEAESLNFASSTITRLLRLAAAKRGHQLDGAAELRSSKAPLAAVQR